VPAGDASVTKRRIVVVSGPVAGGKSHLARALAQRFDGARLSTRELLMPRLAPGETPTRAALQRIGAELDASTDGRWVADRLSRRIYDADEHLVIVDAARIADQIEGLRRAFGREVRHVHITASRETCAKRYEDRWTRAEVQEPATYDEVMSDPTEAQVDSLGPMADIAIDTDRDGPDDVAVRVAAQLGLLDREHAPSVDVIIGGGYGSEGKGNIAFHLAPEYDLLVRVGGPNAAHKVYLASGEIFTHFSLPSGTQAGEAELVLGPGALVYPPELLSEIARCDVNAERLSIDPHVMVIEDADRKAETELAGRIGSTASGTGSATARRIMRGKDVRLARDIDELRPYIRPTYEIFERAYADGKRIMLEGTQGSGLSLHHGPYPSVTSRDTNVAGGLAEAGIAPARVRKVVMVVRTYPIRVGGTSGPMTSELSWEEIERRSGLTGLAERELTSKTKKLRRVGEPEWDLLRRAAMLNAPTDVALTFADYLSAKNAEAWRFEQLTEESIQFIDEVERVTGARVSLISTGFMQFRGIIDRRDW
jgi:adenylosuccinate synthase